MKLLSTLPLLACALTLAAHADETVLFDGKSLSAWKQPLGTWSVVGFLTLDPANPKAFFAKPGEGAMLNSAGSKTVDALTNLEHGDCELHVEFCIPKDSNSGVYLQGRYEVQVFDSFGKTDLKYSDCGGIYVSADPAVGFPGHAPSVNASKPAGEWQTYDIVFRAPRFDASGKKTENARFVKVTLNDQVVQENVEAPAPTRAAHFKDEKAAGPLMLQGDHGPVAYRNLRIKRVPLP